MATGGSVGTCGGGDALPTRPVQVQQDIRLRVLLAVPCVPTGCCVCVLFVLSF